MVLLRSDKCQNDLGFEHGSYHAIINPITCADNQQLTCYLHTAEIPMTNYSINRNNNTLYLYLNEDSLSNMPYKVMLSHRNYTASELVSEIQTKLNSLKSTSDLVDWKNLDGVTLTEDGGNILKSTETPYTGDRGDRVAIFFKTSLDLTKDSSAVSLLDGLVGSNQVKTEIEKFSEQPASGLLYYQSSKLFTYTSPIDSTITGTFQIGCRNTADDLQEIFYIASVPRFKVSLSSSGKIVVKRVDVFGYLPNTTSAGVHLNFADGIFVILGQGLCIEHHDTLHWRGEESSR